MPERTISARYAASKTTKAVSATVYSGSAVPMSAGIMNQNQKITITSGTPRKNSTYTPAASASQRARQPRQGDRRAENESQGDRRQRQAQSAAGEAADADEALEHQERKIVRDDLKIHLRPRRCFCA